MRPFNRVGNILNKMIDRQFHTMPDESKRKWKGQLENTKNTVALQHESPACIWHLQGVNCDQNYQNSFSRTRVKDSFDMTRIIVLLVTLVFNNSHLLFINIQIFKLNFLHLNKLLVYTNSSFKNFFSLAQESKRVPQKTLGTSHVSK